MRSESVWPACELVRRPHVEIHGVRIVDALARLAKLEGVGSRRQVLRVKRNPAGWLRRLLFLTKDLIVHALWGTTGVKFQNSACTSPARLRHTQEESAAVTSFIGPSRFKNWKAKYAGSRISW